MLHGIDFHTKGKKQEGPLFISFIKPYKPVTKQTLARWVNSYLNLAGIQGFSAHSTRKAGSSKAKVKGVKIEDILAKGNWTNKTTFEKFYYKPIDSAARRFQTAVLSFEQ